MLNSHRLLTALILFFSFQTAHSEDLTGDTQNTIEPSSSDSRQFVSMPDRARKLMREDMLSHLSTINEIIAYLSENKLKEAADVAEIKMGKSAMGKHRSTGMGPGRFMTLEMRNIAWGMHEAATEFSKVAKKGNLKNAYSALQNVTSSCVACHYSYRTR